MSFERKMEKNTRKGHILCEYYLTLFRMGLSGATHGWGKGQNAPFLPKICHAYPTMIKLSSYTLLKKIKKRHKSRDAPLEFR